MKTKRMYVVCVCFLLVIVVGVIFYMNTAGGEKAMPKGTLVYHDETLVKDRYL